jgi:hypothetical protein
MNHFAFKERFTPAPGAAIWSGTYQVTSTCNTATCCCVSGTFTVTQAGTQVSATLDHTGSCGGRLDIVSRWGKESVLLALRNNEPSDQKR